MFVATLDTNVLVPGLLRDALLTLAGGNMYDPKWSPRIEQELRGAIARIRRKRGWGEEQIASYLDHLIEQMNRAFPEACVTGWEHLEGTYGVPDPGDEHVVALADHVGAGVIVTDNLRDFDDGHLPGDLHALSGATFIARTIEVNPARAAAELDVMAQRREVSLAELVDMLVVQVGLEATAADLMSPYIEVETAPVADRRS